MPNLNYVSLIRLAIIATVSVIVSGCADYDMDSSLEKSRLRVVDPNEDGDFSDAYYVDTLTGETCSERVLGKLGCP